MHRLNLSPRTPLEVIQAEDAVVRVLTPERVPQFLNWLENPTENRPNKYELDKSKPYTRFNPNTHKEEVYQSALNNENKIHTKKLSSSLLPSNGRMKLFDASYKVGLMFDVTSCDLKDEKYIFKSDADFDLGWHLGEKDRVFNYHDNRDIEIRESKEDARNRYMKSKTTLEGLRQHNRECVKKGIVPDHNDVVVGFQKAGLSALVATADSLTNRTDALLVKVTHAKSLENLPIIILDPKLKKPKIYDEAQQAKDVMDLLLNDNIRDKQKAVNIIQQIKNPVLLSLIQNELKGFPLRLIKNTDTLCEILKKDPVEFIKKNILEPKNKAVFHALLFHPDNVLDKMPIESKMLLLKKANKFEIEPTEHEVKGLFEKNPLMTLNLFATGVISRSVLTKMENTLSVTNHPYDHCRKMIKYFLNPVRKFSENKLACMNLLAKIFHEKNELIAPELLLRVLQASLSIVEDDLQNKKMLQSYITQLHFSILESKPNEMQPQKLTSYLALLSTNPDLEVYSRLTQHYNENNHLMTPAENNQIKTALLSQLLNIAQNHGDPKVQYFAHEQINKILKSKSDIEICEHAIKELKIEAQFISAVNDLAAYVVVDQPKKFSEEVKENMRGMVQAMNLPNQKEVVMNYTIDTLMESLTDSHDIQNDKNAKTKMSALTSLVHAFKESSNDLAHRVDIAPSFRY